MARPTETAASGARAPSSWAAMQIRVFRALWIGALVSNIGTWMQTVGAQWLLVHQPHAATLVALVQTAQALPVLLLALPAGVLADSFDRRHLLIGVQGFQVAVSLVLTLLTLTGQMPPALLLSLTFALGVGAAVQAPAYQALIPDLVPRAQIQGASVLGAINVNIARAIGPAVAGLIVARLGVTAVFALNTASFVFFALVLLAWHRRDQPSASVEPFLPALLAGGRYVSHSLVMRRILLRCVLFVVPANVLWALLALVADTKLHLGASGYGVMLAALGLGSIGGAFWLPHIRAQLSSSQMVAAASVLYAAAMAVLVLVPNPVVGILVMLPAGVAWLAVLASLNAAVQIFLPEWVRARGLAIYQIALFGSMAAAGALWGLVSQAVGLTWTFLAAAVLLVGSAATLVVWPLRNISRLDRSSALYWPEPHVILEPAEHPGTVLVTIRYTVAPQRQTDFLTAMPALRRSRRRTGATSWYLYRDAERPQEFLETYTVASWDEHLLQHGGRLTEVDRQVDDRVKQMSDPPTLVTHLFTAPAPE